MQSVLANVLSLKKNTLDECGDLNSNFTEEQLPYTMTLATLSLVSLDEGAEELMLLQGVLITWRLDQQ